MPVAENTVHYLEIVTPDAAAAVSFYEQLYGWRFQQMGPELGSSYVAELPNGSRCGIRAPEIPGHGTIAIYIHGGVEQGLWQL